MRHPPGLSLLGGECFRGVARLFRRRIGYGFGGGKDGDMLASAVADLFRKSGGKDEVRRKSLQTAHMSFIL